MNGIEFIFSRHVRDFFLSVAKDRDVQPMPDPCQEEPNTSSLLDLPQLSELLPVGWKHTLFCTNRPRNLLLEFSFYFTDWLGRQEDGQIGTVPITYVEILFLLKEEPGCPFPSQHNQVDFERRPLRTRMIRPTVAVLFVFVSAYFCFVARLFGCESHLCTTLRKPELGIFCPLSGFRLGLSPDALKEAREAILTFNAARPMRTAADFARPA